MKNRQSVAKGNELGTKKTIYESALTLFAEKGFHAVSMRDTSSLAGCNVSAISYHFGSKEELYQHCLYQNWEGTEYILEQSLQDVSSYNEFCDKVRFIIFHAIESIVHNPKKSQLVIREMHDFSKPLQEGRLGGFNKATRMLEDFIKLAQSKGIVKLGLDPEFASSFILGLVSFKELVSF